MTNLVRDAMGLLHVLGVPQVKSVIGHDFGSPVAAWCACGGYLYECCVMSAPCRTTRDCRWRRAVVGRCARQFIKLRRPRKHYQWYYSTREANEHMWHAPQGQILHARIFSREVLIGAATTVCTANQRADQLALMPTYYIMDLDATMAETVEAYLPSDEATAQRKNPRGLLR